VKPWPPARPAPSSFDSRAEQWEIRYLLETEAEPVSEFFKTKQMARDRFANIAAAGHVEFCEIRAPSGKLWFRDTYFEKGARRV